MGGRRHSSKTRDFAIALRFLAPSLAGQGETNKAASVMWENLAVEPGLTPTKLRAGLPFLSDWCWSRYSEGLRVAGLLVGTAPISLWPVSPVRAWENTHRRQRRVA
jgi:hypothetical protein